MFQSTLEQTESVEAALLSLIINAGDNGLFLRAYEVISPEHFADPFHQRLYRELQQMVLNKSVLIDKTLLRAKIKQPEYRQKFERIISEHTSMENFTEYVNTIKRSFQTRKFKSILLDMTVRTQQETEGDPVTWVSSLEDQLLTVVSDNAGSFAAPRDLMPEIFKQFAEGKHEAALKLPIPDLNSMLFGIHPGYYVVAARPSMGKEQPVDTPVLAEDGWRPIGELSIGDKVYGQNGKLNNVTGVFPQGKKDSYRVTFSDGTSTECGIEHLWTVYSDGGYRGQQKPTTKTLKELIEIGITRDKGPGRIGAKWKIPIVEPIQFPEQLLPIDPYVLGVLIGDGSLSGKDKRFSCSDRDIDIADRVRHTLSSIDVDINKYTHEGSCPYYNLQGDGVNELLGKLESMGLRVHAGEKHIPKQYLSASIEQRMQLLYGLMDTDGTFACNIPEFDTTSKQLAEDIAELGRSLGGVCVVKTYDRTHQDKGIEYRVSFKIDFCPFLTEYKKNAWNPRAYSPSKYIYSVEKLEPKEQVCIMVDASDHLYITNDYIVTHNTAFVMDWAVFNAIRGYRTLVFSLEMDRLSLTNRIIANVAEVPHFAIRSRDVTPEQFQKIKRAEETISSLNIEIDDTPGISVHELAARAKRYKIKHPDLAMIIVDYIQLLAEGGSGGTREGEVRQMSQVLKNLGRALGVPIVVLSQLSRKVEERQDKRPIMSDLRDSGSLEQDADVVIFLFADSYYDNQRKGFKCWDTEIIVSKHRNGPVGIVPSVHNKDFQKFEPPGGNREDEEGDEIIFHPEETKVLGINVT